MMLTHECLNCGKTLYIKKNGKMNVYCDNKCQQEYRLKKRQAKAEAAAEKARLRTTLVPESQCRKCIYGCDYGGRYGCGYVYTHDHSRHSLHPEGMPAECQEYTPRRKRRKNVGISVK